MIKRVEGRKVTIDWTPPDSDGGSRVSQYVIHYSTSDVDLELFVKPKTARRSKRCTFSKQLKFNMVYKFAVAAKNESRLGPLSEFSECVKTSTSSGKYVIYYSGKLVQDRTTVATDH